MMNAAWSASTVPCGIPPASASWLNSSSRCRSACPAQLGWSLRRRLSQARAARRAAAGGAARLVVVAVEGGHVGLRGADAWPPDEGEADEGGAFGVEVLVGADPVDQVGEEFRWEWLAEQGAAQECLVDAFGPVFAGGSGFGVGVAVRQPAAGDPGQLAYAGVPGFLVPEVGHLVVGEP